MENQRKPHEYNYKPGNVKGNSREDAEICLKIARQAMNEGDTIRAKKFAAKAERMYRTREGKDLLDALTRKESGRTEGVGRHAVKKEQEDEVRRVKEARDVYDVLGVQKDYSPVDVTKAFRRLSLILHPDRNKAQGAKEAYMTVTEAVQRLKSPKTTTKVGN